MGGIRLVAVVLLAGVGVRPTAAADAVRGSPEQDFAGVVRPFLKSYCLACHGSKTPKAGLDLGRYPSAATVLDDEKVWGQVLECLEAAEMPPRKAARQPSPSERRAVIAWLQDLRERDARRNAGDPGRVPPRRLSNAEFDYTIRDLTGVDIRPAREFPVDPANEAGFDNSGESLAMSPALLKKYLEAARRVADHLVLKPRGFDFAPHPAVTDTDRDRYAVQRIAAFYRRHRVDYADYFLAAWRYRHRAALGQPDRPLGDFAAERHLSGKYLATAWRLLQEPQPAGPVQEVQRRWRELPTDVAKHEEARRGCERLRDDVIRVRRGLTPGVGRLRAPGISDGSQPFILWRNRQVAARHLSAAPGSDAAARQRFGRVFPDTFVVLERAPYYDSESRASGRLLSAGFHLMHGYDRDDGPLYELVLDTVERREIDTLWDELHFVTRDAARQYKDFIFFERAEPPRFMREAAFDFARSEDADAVSDAKIKQLRTAYLAKARRLGAGAQALEAIERYFADIAARIRHVEESRRAAEPSHLAALQDFAARAYRRPLSAAEREDIVAFYHDLRDRDGLGHEDAVRDVLASILLSPHFCYRIDLPGPAAPGRGAAGGKGTAVRPLSDFALASRLSYFLWSSMPDAELLSHAAVGDLHRPEVLAAQARRLLRDGRVRRLAEQFAGSWLEFRRFEEENTVDRARFPGFTNDLRRAMAEEPIRFFTHVASQDRPVLDFLDGGYTFVNPVLAKHYGIPLPPDAGGADDWVRVEDAQQYGRGGLLPMAVFLTKNAPGLRTSPVKRGYWVVRRLLGQRIPPPPPEVPELPKDEASLGSLTLPQLLASHRAGTACAGCHQRFDSIGLAFEGYDPVGARRTRDLGGRPVEATATFPDGSKGTGLDGLRLYLKAKRQDEFVENLCRKLFAYALGRSLMLSDQPTIDAMRTRLARDRYRLGSLVESIVTGPQFRNQRSPGPPGQ